MPPLQNGELAAAVRQQQHQLQGKASRRLAALLLLLRGAALCASAAVTGLAAADAAALRRAPFRFLLAADAIVAAYSAFEAGAAAWELARGATLMPEAMQLWFDFAHDQGFGYMALAAAAAAARDSASLRSDLTVGLGFAAFALLALAALVTGFRLACFVITGSRFPRPTSGSY